MSKGFQQFYNIFLKNKSKLETDAVPTTEESDQQEPINTNSSFGSIPPDSQLSSNLEVVNRTPSKSSVEQFHMVPPESNVELFNPRNPATNNLLAVDHTQVQVIHQFSNVNNLHLGSRRVYNFGGGTAPKNSDAPQKRKKTRTIDAMLRSNEKLSIWMLREISRHLGEHWQFVMRDLGFSDALIYQFRVDYMLDGGIQEVIYQLLLDWTRNDDNPTLGKITKALWKLEHYETVQAMKVAWKNENNKPPSEESDNSVPNLAARENL